MYESHSMIKDTNSCEKQLVKVMILSEQ